MAMRRLRVYTGPDLSQPNVAVLEQPAENRIRIPLGQVLPLLAEAVASNRTWLTDFKDDVGTFEVEGFEGVNDAYDVARERLDAVKRERHERGATAALHALEAACRGTQNIMPFMMDALDAEVTLGEIGSVYREVWGDWQTPEVV